MTSAERMERNAVVYTKPRVPKPTYEDTIRQADEEITRALATSQGDRPAGERARTGGNA